MHSYSRRNVKNQLVRNCPVSSDELCCPVCDISLARRPSPKPIKGTGREAVSIRNELRQMYAGQMRDTELVVSAECGHLFHRFCLRHYCFIYHQTHTNQQVECPSCCLPISMVKTLSIDFKSHLRIASAYEKEFRESILINDELNHQKKRAVNHLENMEKRLDEAKTKLETYRTHHECLGDKSEALSEAFNERDRLYKHIEQCNKGIDAMHKENISIIRMYLTIMKDQPEEFLREKRIPDPLIPYLAVILADENLLRKFGEIIKPIEINGLRSNTELLIKEILADVGPKVREMKNSTITELKEWHHQSKRHTKPSKPVVVKVERSSLSIFSRSVLDQDSLQTIMDQVKEPIDKLKVAHEKSKKTQPKPVYRSVSDIEVILEPRKRHLVSVSHPAKISDIEDTYFLPKVPPRRCKSTEPILVKSKGTKAIVVKVEDLKNQEQEEGEKLNKVGDGPEFPSQTTPIIESKPSSSAEILLQEMSVQRKEVELVEFNTKVEKMTFEPNAVIHSTDNSANTNSCMGFEPCPSGSVLEMLMVDGVANVNNFNDNHNSMENLVKDVSRITLGPFKNNKTCPTFGATSTVIDIAVPFIKYTVPLSSKASSNSTNIMDLDFADESKSSNSQMILPEQDIENAMRPSELIVPNCERKSNGVLKGILPGPYQSNLKESNMKTNITTKKQQSNHAFNQLPVYQTKWLTKLPSSTRKEHTQFKTKVFLPLLQPPKKQDVCNNSSREQLIDAGRNCTRNRPYGDIRESVSRINHKKPDTPNHTVINIPSSNYTLPPLQPQKGDHHSGFSNGYYSQFQPNRSLKQTPNNVLCYAEKNKVRCSSNSLQNLVNVRGKNVAHRHEQVVCNISSLSSPVFNSYSQHDVQSKKGHDQKFVGRGKSCSSMSSSRSLALVPNSTTVALQSTKRTEYVEKAMVELCRGLSPPKTRISNTFLPVNNDQSQNSVKSHAVAITDKKSMPASTMFICPDGISPRIVRRAKRRFNVNV